MESWHKQHYTALNDTAEHARADNSAPSQSAGSGFESLAAHFAQHHRSSGHLETLIATASFAVKSRTTLMDMRTSPFVSLAVRAATLSALNASFRSTFRADDKSGPNHQVLHRGCRPLARPALWR